MNNLPRIAEYLRDLMAPLCERVAVAGSVRRGKPDPHDIELVAIPKTQVAVARRDMFADADVTMAERDLLAEFMDELKGEGTVTDRLGKDGKAAWGPKFKRCIFDGVPLDLFCTTPPQWGVIFAIRTGPADFSRAVVTSRLEGGFMPGGMQVKDGCLWRQGQTLPTVEEEDFFAFLRLPCWPPRERSLLRLSQWKREAVRT